MKETRAGKYGRFLAIVIDYIVEQIPESERISYKRVFLEEIANYSEKPRKKDEPRNGGVWELAGIDKIDIRNPVHLARFVKEGWHLQYQKQTTARERMSFLENL